MYIHLRSISWYGKEILKCDLIKVVLWAKNSINYDFIGFIFVQMSVAAVFVNYLHHMTKFNRRFKCFVVHTTFSFWNNRHHVQEE